MVNSSPKIIENGDISLFTYLNSRKGEITSNALQHGKDWTFCTSGSIWIRSRVLIMISAAEPSKDTDVFYTTSSTNIDADGKVVMVVPASGKLDKRK